MNKEIRTRIAPSPTGYVHVGTLRTALFNYFFAKQNEGIFYIRLEDTDQTRLVENSDKNLLEVFNKLGIQFDEGLILENSNIKQIGNYGPYIQSQRLEIYKKYADELVVKGMAYHCFCTKDRLEKMRDDQQKLKSTPKYDRKCVSLEKEEIRSRIEAGEQYVIRLKVPAGDTEFIDLIRGKVVFKNEQIDDQVLIKADGFPTYHLAVVVDDYLMKTSHVIRGEEWLSSTPKHVILFNAFGFDLPQFAHLPLLLNPDKSKLSKRQGDVSVEDFLNKGYLKETMINFIGTLGFNPSSDREIFSLNELINLFDISKVNKSGAVLNHDKLNWMNSQYINSIELEDLIDRLEKFSGKAFNDFDKKVVAINRSRATLLSDLLDFIRNPYVENFDYSLIVWKKSDSAEALNILNDVKIFIDTLNFETVAVIEETLKAWISENGYQNGNVLWPLRVALSGSERSASPFELMWLFGKDMTLQRIDKAIDGLKKMV